jgi:hypothetical protein
VLRFEPNYWSAVLGEYLDLLLASLAKLEAVSDNRAMIEANLARVNLSAILGEPWVEKYVLSSPHPDPWMLNGNDDWFKAHPVSGTDMRRAMRYYRVVRLSDAFSTILSGKIEDGDLLRKRFRERTDLRALFAELEIASLLVRNKVSVKVVEESGKRGEDFDLLATIRGAPVSVEITVIQEDAAMSTRSILNRLRSKRTQVSAIRPAILYLVVPDAWMKNYSLAALIFDAAIRRVFLQSRRFNAIVLSWEKVTATGDMPIIRHLQAVYNNHPRFYIPDYNVFGAKGDKWGISGYSDSLLNRLRAYRLRQQIRNDATKDIRAEEERCPR